MKQEEQNLPLKVRNYIWNLTVEWLPKGARREHVQIDAMLSSSRLFGGQTQRDQPGRIADNGFLPAWFTRSVYVTLFILPQSIELSNSP